MADAMLHIQDSYYFEVPKFLAPGSRIESADDVPAWLYDPEWIKDEQLLKEHPALEHDKQLIEAAQKDISLWQEELAGKVLIPQPFGSPKNLYEPGTGFAISKFMILEVVAAVLMIGVFVWLGRRMTEQVSPQGRCWNFFEAILLFIRDGIARVAIGEKEGDQFAPLLWTIFFFILFCNLLGLVPWLGTATGSLSVTVGLAVVAFTVTIGAGIAALGPAGFWLNMVPHIELEGLLKPLEYVIKLVVFVIEVIGLVIRHAVLAIRLLANMAAGHLVILSILGLIVMAANTAGPAIYSMVAVAGVLGTVAINLLELLVAFIQAYVFTFLSALFIGAAVHHH